VELKFFAWMRSLPIRHYAVVGLVLGPMAFGHFQVTVFAATGPVRDTAIDPLIADSATGTPPETATAPMPTGNPLWAVPLGSLSITRARPLFSPSRRPPAPAVIAVPAAPPPPPKPAEPDHPLLALVGTIVGNPKNIGVFADPIAKKFIHLTIGQDHAGWVLRAVDSREATFEKDQHKSTITLPSRNAPSQVAPTVARPTAVTGQPGSPLVGPSSPKPPWMSGAPN